MGPISSATATRWSTFLPRHPHRSPLLVSPSRSQRSTPTHPASLQIALTGETRLTAAGKSSGLGGNAETIIAGVGVLAILAFVFASVLAVIPLVIAAVSILATFLILLGLSYVTQVSFVLEFLVSLIGPGIAIDYSLLIVTRWR